MKQLFDVHRRLTKSALRIPFNRNADNYLSYEERCARLRQLKPKDRLNIAYAMLAVKSVKNEIKSTVNDKFQAMYNRERGRLRNEHLFNIDRVNLVHKSPVKLAIHYANFYAPYINHEHTSQTIRRNLNKRHLPI